MIKKKIFEALDIVTDSFFPEDPTWYSTCFSKPNTLNKEYLPCHLRDTEWLTLMYKSEVMFISEDIIREYINTSPYFDKKRREHEQKIIKWQIRFIMNGGENWLVDPKLGGDFYILGPNVDKAVRKGVLKTLEAIGMNHDAIEQGIEENVGMWRENTMKSSYRNIYEPVFYIIPESKDDTFEREWIKLRLYEYYQEHKDSVERYGVITPEMQISEEEAANLRDYIETVGKKKLEELEKNKRPYKFSFDIFPKEETIVKKEDLLLDEVVEDKPKKKSKIPFGLRTPKR